MNSNKRKICIRNIYRNLKIRHLMGSKKYHRKYPYKIKTQHKLQYLFDISNLTNNDFICAMCGKQQIEKHHENYDLPFVFIPLCVKCHGKNKEKLIKS